VKNKSIKNLAASVHQRLLDKARQTGRPFNELLQYFTMERYKLPEPRRPKEISKFGQNWTRPIGLLFSTSLRFLPPFITACMAL
jgi:hypothetical protein